MNEESKIEWTDATFNPWEGRLTGGSHCGSGAPLRRTSEANWRKPIKWNRDAADFIAKYGRRQRVFCASLADVFDNAVDSAWRDDLWDLIRACPNLTWQILTKRPQNIPKMLPSDWGDGWDHVWLGTSAGNQDTADKNIDALLNAPAKLHFLSCEPMLGYVTIQSEINRSPNRIRWVICGGESGPNARPMRSSWPHFLQRECEDHGVPFFFNQWGEYAPQLVPTGEMLSDGRTEFKKIEMVKVGKRQAGRLLGGEEYNEFPPDIGLDLGTIEQTGGGFCDGTIRTEIEAAGVDTAFQKS